MYARSLSCSQYWQRVFGPGRGLLRILIGGDTPRMSGRSANEGGVIWHSTSAVRSRSIWPLWPLEPGPTAGRMASPIPRDGCAASVSGDDGNGHPPTFRHICQLAAHPADLSRQTRVFGQSCNRVLSRDRGSWNPTTFQHHFTRR